MNQLTHQDRKGMKMTKAEYFLNETAKHIRNVQLVMCDMIHELVCRLRLHDVSKYDSVEADLFTEVMPELSKSEYDSPAYRENLRKIKSAIDHHHEINPHHPEYYRFYYECNGCFTRYESEVERCEKCGYTQFEKRPYFEKMSLIDLIEMIADWMAASTRNPNGDIINSIEKNQKRFGYSDEMTEILKNTAREFMYNIKIMEQHDKYVGE